MMKPTLSASLICCFSLLFSPLLFSQMSYDTSITMDKRNVIRYNPTPSLLVGLESTIFGYERVIKPHQSVSVNIGRLKFRQFVDFGLSNFGVTTNRKSGGFSLVADYRRYFRKRNRAFAPDGLYWGPYVAYYAYRHELGANYTDPLSATTSDVLLTTRLKSLHVGLEVGYQFVVARRVTFDLIFIGPSFGSYQADFNIDGNLVADQESDLYKAFIEVLVDRFPGINTLIKDRNVSKSGNFYTNTIGMRYVFQIGFLF